MTQVVRGVEAVQRALAALVEVHVVALPGIVVRREDVDAGRRVRADDVVDDAAEALELVDVVLGRELVDVLPGKSRP